MTSSIEFKLFAPNNQGAALIASFSDWQAISMTKAEDGYFRIQVALEDGIYQYKFRVQSKSPNFLEQWIDVIDPYATNIDEAKNYGIVEIKDGKHIVDTYVWQHDDINLPNNTYLVIYEMHIADFSGGENDPNSRGKYQDAIEKLDYLKALGINAIELMPVSEYPGDYSWGYKVRHFFATESSYGSTTDLKRLIDECHGRGIRVFMDGIYNHTDEECPLMLIDRNYWYYRHKHYPEDPANYWGPEFNYDNYDQNLKIKPAWKYVGDVVRYWIEEYHLDGIRFDAVRQIANVEFLDWLAKKAKQAAKKKPFYNIAEHIPDTNSIVSPSGPMDACWHESFRYFIIPHICGETFEIEKLKEVLDPKRQGYETTTNVINYLATHDREHIMRELENRGISGVAAFRRAKLAAVLLMTAMGVPMLWMGEEFAEAKRKSEKVTQPKKIAWPLLEKPLNHDLFAYYQKLIALRQQNSALSSDNIDFFHENPQAKVLTYSRWQADSRVIIVTNFSDSALEHYHIPNFPEAKWQEWNSDTQVETTNQEMVINLPKFTAKIFVETQKV